MSTFTIKLHDKKFNRDYYLEWTTICDAPATQGMTLDEYRSYYQRKYGSDGMRNFDRYVKQADDMSQGLIDHYIRVNHAGVKQGHLSLEKLLDMYCRGEEQWMECILHDIGWDEIYTDTLKRMRYIRDAFRLNFTQEQISNKELDEYVALTFGVYGQGEVYDIYSQAIQLLKRSNNDIHIDLYYPEKAELDYTLADAIKGFMDAFKDTIPEVYVVMKPKAFISLFIEYLFALHIKGGHL